MKFAQIYVHQYCGEGFCAYVLNLTNYALQKFIKNEFGVEVEPCSNDFQLNQAIEDEISKREENLSSITSLENKRAQIDYLKLRKATLEEQLRDMDKDTESLLSRGKELVGGGDGVHTEESLKIDVFKKKAELSQKHNQIDKLASRTQEQIRELWNILDDVTGKQDSLNIDLLSVVPNHDLRHFMTENSIDLDKMKNKAILVSDCYKKELEAWTNIEECDSLVSRFSAIKEEIEKSVVSTLRGLDNMEAAKAMMMEHITAERRKLLSDPRIVSKRRNVSLRLYPILGHLSNIKINFCSKPFRPRQSIIDSHLTSPTVPSPNGHYRKSDYSFHPGDISVFSYVAPRAPDGYVLSPLREEW